MTSKDEPQDQDGRDTAARQPEREREQARNHADESGPLLDEQEEANPAQRDDGVNPPRECHRRGCDEPAMFVVLERYQEETGHGAVEAEAALCQEHTAEENPTNLDGAYADYVFRVRPLPDADNADAM